AILRTLERHVGAAGSRHADDAPADRVDQTALPFGERRVIELEDRALVHALELTMDRVIGWAAGVGEPVEVDAATRPAREDPFRFPGGDRLGPVEARRQPHEDVGRPHEVEMRRALEPRDLRVEGSAAGPLLREPARPPEDRRLLDAAATEHRGAHLLEELRALVRIREIHDALAALELQRPFDDLRRDRRPIRPPVLGRCRGPVQRHHARAGTATAERRATPPCRTCRTFRVARMSANGSPSTMRTSASFPGRSVPTMCAMPSAAALPLVARVRTCSGVSAARTRSSSSRCTDQPGTTNALGASDPTRIVAPAAMS